MGDNISTRWFWKDWARDTGRLTFAEKGLWIDLIEQTYHSLPLGVYKTTLGALGEVKEVWGLLKKLGVKKIGDIYVTIGKQQVQLTEENLQIWREVEPDDLMPVKVVCRRVVEHREELIKEREKYLRRKERKGQGGCNGGVNTGAKGGVKGGVKGGESEGKEAPTRARILPGSHTPSTTDVVPPVTGGTGGKGKHSKAGRVEENTELMVRIGAWFKRRPATLWAKEEAARLEELNPTEEEVELLERYYRSEDPNIARYRRHDLVTMLNNWTKECDWARRKLEGGEAAESVEGEGPRMVGMEMF